MKISSCGSGADEDLVYVGEVCTNVGSTRAAALLDAPSGTMSFRDVETGATVAAANIVACPASSSSSPVVFGLFCTSTGSKAFGLYDPATATVSFLDWKTGAAVAAANVLAECTVTPGAARIANATWAGVAGMRSFSATSQTGTFDVSFDAGATWTTGFIGSRTWGTSGRPFAAPANIRVRSPSAASDVDIVWEV